MPRSSDDPRGEPVDGGPDVDRRREVAQEPFGAARERAARRPEKGDLPLGPDLPCQQLELAEQRHQAEGVARDDVGARHRRRGTPGALAELADELAEPAVDQAVGDQGRDDLAAQTMLRDLAREALAQRPRKILDQVLQEIRVVRQIGCQQLVVQGHLGIGDQHRDLGPEQALAHLPAVVQRLVVGQDLELAIQPAAAPPGAG